MRNGHGTLDAEASNISDDDPPVPRGAPSLTPLPALYSHVLCLEQYNSFNGSITCFPCALGRFADHEGMTECELCPAGKRSFNFDSGTPCEKGKYCGPRIPPVMKQVLK